MCTVAINFVHFTYIFILMWAAKCLFRFIHAILCRSIDAISVWLVLLLLLKFYSKQNSTRKMRIWWKKEHTHESTLNIIYLLCAGCKSAIVMCYIIVRCLSQTITISIECFIFFYFFLCLNFILFNIFWIVKHVPFSNGWTNTR